jgi:hypothetical protein
VDAGGKLAYVSLIVSADAGTGMHIPVKSNAKTKPDRIIPVLIFIE